jgi:hypothetical protein
VSSETVTKRTKVIVKSAAGCVGVAGACAIVFTVIPLLRNFTRFERWPDVLFLFVFPLPAIALGCYCLFIAIC